MAVSRSLSDIVASFQHVSRGSSISVLVRPSANPSTNRTMLLPSRLSEKSVSYFIFRLSTFNSTNLLKSPIACPTDFQSPLCPAV